MRPILVLSALLLLAPTALAQTGVPYLLVNLESPPAGLDDGDAVLFHGEVTRSCPTQAMILDPTPVRFKVSTPPEVLVQLDDVALPQQICAQEMDQHVGFTGTVVRAGGEAGAYPVLVQASVPPSMSGLVPGAESEDSMFLVRFNETAGTASSLDEAPTADTPFPVFAAPLALAAVALARRRS